MYMKKDKLELLAIGVGIFFLCYLIARTAVDIDLTQLSL